MTAARCAWVLAFGLLARAAQGQEPPAPGAEAVGPRVLGWELSGEASDANPVRREWLNLGEAQREDGSYDGSLAAAEIGGDRAATALASLAFLGCGHTEKAGKFRVNVCSAAARLRSWQDGKGRLSDETRTHALCALALSEAAGMARVPDTVRAAQASIDALVAAQKKDGGFAVRMDGEGAEELVETTFACMAFKSAKVAGLNVPPEAFKGVISYADRVADKDHLFQGQHKTLSKAEATTFVLIMRQFCGWKREDLEKAADIALAEKPDASKPRFLHWWLATLVAFQQGGQRWQAWNGSMKPVALGRYTPVMAKEADLDPKVRSKAKELIARLGSDDFETREAASAELASIGPSTAVFLRETMAASKDPEVQMRLGQILDRWASYPIPTALQSLTLTIYYRYLPVLR